jgi:hypothetical protein
LTVLLNQMVDQLISLLLPLAELDLLLLTAEHTN